MELGANLNDFGAFQHSNHSKTFQDVYYKAGVVNMDGPRSAWEHFLLQLK
jgi:hypothetical protein